MSASRNATERRVIGGASQDLYEVLELSPNARREVVQAAYKALARMCHPDVNDSPEAAQRMRMLNAAYEVLNDPSRRAAYDVARMRLQRRAQLMRAAEPRGGYAAGLSNGLPAPRPVAARLPRAEERLWPLGPQMVAGIAALAVLVALVMFVIWLTLSVLDDTPSLGATVVQVEDRAHIVEFPQR